MILEEGSKLFVVHRRLFENDRNRYFVGVVNAYDAGLAKVTGQTWLKDPMIGSFIKKGDLKTKIFSLASGTLMVYEIPKNTDMNNVRLERLKDGQEVLTDGLTLNMSVAESERLA